MTHQGGVPPGWYDEGTGTQRWWDGQRWTDHRRGPQPPAQHPYPQAPWPGYYAAPPARRRTSRALWIALAVAAVLLVGYAVNFAVNRNSHNEWYQKGYDAGMKASLIDNSMAELACSVAVMKESGSHERDIKRGCYDAINKRLAEKKRNGSP